MLRQTLLFQGYDASGNYGLWETNGTAPGTYELTGIVNSVFNPSDFADLTVFNGKMLFEAEDVNIQYGLWVTDGTAAGTTEVGGFGSTAVSGAGPNGLFVEGPYTNVYPDFTVFNSEVLFNGIDANDFGGLWVTNGTAASTHEITGINGAWTGYTGPDGDFRFNPTDMTVFNGEVLFNGRDASGYPGLWVTNGTGAGTVELGGISNNRIPGASAIGLQPSYLTAFNSEVLFNGLDASTRHNLWVTNGTGLGTSEIAGIGGAYSGGLDPRYLTYYSGELLFQGVDTGGLSHGLWVTNGTVAGTHEITGINGANTYGIFGNSGIRANLTVFNGEVLFQGDDSSNHIGLWVTNGTAAGTSELTGISGAFSGGIFNFTNSNFAVFNGEVLFQGEDSSNHIGLWVTNGTAAGTHELTGISGANPAGVTPYDLTPAALIIPPPDDFLGNNTSDILFRSTSSGDTWFEAMSNGAPSEAKPWQQIGGSDTHYDVVGDGDFYGTGAADILFRNVSTGDTWFEVITDGAAAGWHQIGGSDAHYSVAGLGDFSGYGTSDILFRNTTTGDTWFEATSNGAFNGWRQIGGSDTHYSVVGVGNFFESGIDDILFRNNSTGDTWIEAITNGASAGWDQIGGSDTHYSVVGVGDFFGNGTNDILFRNNSTGDTWFEAVSNGTSAGWHQVGGSDTTYSVVGIGDYFGTNTSDILFRNASTGDTWFEAISNGASVGWHQVGGSSTSYSVPITVGPPALT